MRDDLHIVGEDIRKTKEMWFSIQSSSWKWVFKDYLWCDRANMSHHYLGFLRLRWQEFIHQELDDVLRNLIRKLILSSRTNYARCLIEENWSYQSLVNLSWMSILIKVAKQSYKKSFKFAQILFERLLVAWMPNISVKSLFTYSDESNSAINSPYFAILKI